MCTCYIICSLSYTMNNSWVNKGVQDTVSKYYIELEEQQERHIWHGFEKIGNLIIDTLKNCMIFNWDFFSLPSLNVYTMQVINNTLTDITGLKLSLVHL